MDENAVYGTPPPQAQGIIEERISQSAAERNEAGKTSERGRSNKQSERSKPARRKGDERGGRSDIDVRPLLLALAQKPLIPSTSAWRAVTASAAAIKSLVDMAGAISDCCPFVPTLDASSEDAAADQTAPSAETKAEKVGEVTSAEHAAPPSAPHAALGWLSVSVTDAAKICYFTGRLRCAFTGAPEPFTSGVAALSAAIKALSGAGCASITCDKDALRLRGEDGGHSGKARIGLVLPAEPSHFPMGPPSASVAVNLAQLKDKCSQAHDAKCDAIELALLGSPAKWLRVTSMGSSLNADLEWPLRVAPVPPPQGLVAAPPAAEGAEISAADADDDAPPEASAVVQKMEFNLDLLNKCLRAVGAKAATLSFHGDAYISIDYAIGDGGDRGCFIVMSRMPDEPPMPI